jgi:hypothetical protein
MGKNMNNSKLVIRIGQVLLFLNALLWIVAGASYIFRVNPSDSAPFWMILVVGLGMLVYGGILVLMGLLLAQKRKAYFYTTVALLGLSIILPVFDQFGLADLIALVPVICAFIYLLFKRQVFLGASPIRQKSSI